MRAIDAILGLFGVGIHRVPGRNFDAVLRDVIRKCYALDEQLTIFDVGAHEGESIERFMWMRPNSTIHAFEPQVECYKRLVTRYLTGGHVRIFNSAVGESEREVSFNVHPSATGSSSMLKVDETSRFAKRRHIVAIPQKSYMVTLDGYCEQRNIDRINVLKIDVQGYEREVLEGASFLLTYWDIDIVQVEVIVGEAYQGRSSFRDIEKLLPGYRLIACSPDGRFGYGRAFDVIANPELQFDLIYVAPHIWEKICGSEKTLRDSPVLVSLSA